MRDQRGGNGDNSYQRVKNICEDVRAVGQRNQWAICSVTQVNGDGYESTNLTPAIPIVNANPIAATFFAFINKTSFLKNASI